MVPLPVWKIKVKKHAKRKANNAAPGSSKDRRLMNPHWTQRKALLEGELDYSLTLMREKTLGRWCVCHTLKELVLSLTPSALELDSIVTVWSQIILREIKEPASSDTVMKDILEMISEPSGSEELNGESVPILVGMSSGTVKFARPKPKVADARVCSYDELIEC